MRGVLGLVAILGMLVAMVLILNYAYLPYTQQVVRSGNIARSEAQQMAGMDAALGGRVSDHIRFDAVNQANRLIALEVGIIRPGSSYQNHYGLLQGDIVEHIGPQSIRDIGDHSLATALAYEAYQRNWDIVIVRHGQRFTLPRDSALAANVSAAVNTPVAPEQPPPTPPDTRSPLQRQLDAITTHGQ